MEKGKTFLFLPLSTRPHPTAHRHPPLHERVAQSSSCGPSGAPSSIGRARPSAARSPSAQPPPIIPSPLNRPKSFLPCGVFAHVVPGPPVNPSPPRRPLAMADAWGS
jgi:hypothetical protein